MPTAFFVLQGLLFVFWVICAFRWLFHLLGRAQRRSGVMLPGPGNISGTIREWWNDPAERRFRNAFVALTVAMLGLNALMVPLLAAA